MGRISKHAGQLGDLAGPTGILVPAAFLFARI
jgi:hypothetical protein